MYKDYVKQNDIWEEKAKKLYEAQKLKDYYSKLSSKMLSELVSLSGEQDSSGKEYVLSTHSRLGSVEYNRIPELKTVDLNKYRKDNVKVWKLEYVGNMLNEIRKNHEVSRIQ